MNLGKAHYDLEERLIGFAVGIADRVETLPDTRVGRHIAGQLIGSGTSAAPNYGEAQSVESRKDFIHKLKLGLKELRETHIRLRIISRKQLVTADTLHTVLQECNELIAIFVASIATARQHMTAQGD